jgi:hypothetical protein
VKYPKKQKHSKGHLTARRVISPLIIPNTKAYRTLFFKKTVLQNEKILFPVLFLLVNENNTAISRHFQHLSLYCCSCDRNRLIIIEKSCERFPCIAYF